MERNNVISIPITRDNTFEKIMSEISRYRSEHGIDPNFVLVDCFSVEFLIRQHDNSYYQIGDMNRIFVCGISIIPLESLDEFIQANTSDHTKLMKQVIKNVDDKLSKMF